MSKSGICDKREELFSELFDEIIRQCTIQQAERGMLLIKVRDQIKTTLASYKILHQSSILFCNQKQMLAHNQLHSLFNYHQQLLDKNSYLNSQIRNLTALYSSLTPTLNYFQQNQQDKNQKEINFWTQSNISLQNVLNNVISNQSLQQEKQF